MGMPMSRTTVWFTRLKISIGKDHAGTPNSTRKASMGIHIRFVPESASIGNSIRTRLLW